MYAVLVKKKFVALVDFFGFGVQATKIEQLYRDVI